LQDLLPGLFLALRRRQLDSAPNGAIAKFLYVPAIKM
jgi:hypothetical protein